MCRYTAVTQKHKTGQIWELCHFRTAVNSHEILKNSVFALRRSFPCFLKYAVFRVFGSFWIGAITARSRKPIKKDPSFRRSNQGILKNTLFLIVNYYVLLAHKSALGHSWHLATKMHGSYIRVAIICVFFYLIFVLFLVKKVISPVLLILFVNFKTKVVILWFLLKYWKWLFSLKALFWGEGFKNMVKVVLLLGALDLVFPAFWFYFVQIHNQSALGFIHDPKNPKYKYVFLWVFLR